MIRKFKLSCLLLLTAFSSFTLLSCEEFEPEIIIINDIDSQILVKDISFNGCLWNTVLPYGEATSPKRCFPGSDRIRFQRFDAEEYCMLQAEKGYIDSICLCDEPMRDPTLIRNIPLWFRYQTIRSRTAKYGRFHVFVLTAEDQEQDFSAPGPFGH